ncbi:hypothetical protein EV356DRAFT_87184 [Viridothelium virens]|uniref:Uncharacterized protein n=1 Tax=Viridothelium virens TaxID=1048519 RepID=A0A6A6HDG3_VIRVR|nr:hypothetical protein EV356DRAFT_87184 [Viridothelium virens]
MRQGFGRFRVRDAPAAKSCIHVELCVTIQHRSAVKPLTAEAIPCEELLEESPAVLIEHELIKMTTTSLTNIEQLSGANVVGRPWYHAVESILQAAFGSDNTLDAATVKSFFEISPRVSNLAKQRASTFATIANSMYEAHFLAFSSKIII